MSWAFIKARPKVAAGIFVALALLGTAFVAKRKEAKLSVTFTSNPSEWRIVRGTAEDRDPAGKRRQWISYHLGPVTIFFSRQISD